MVGAHTNTSKTVTKYQRNALALAVDVYAYQMSPLIETTV